MLMLSFAKRNMDTYLSQRGKLLVSVLYIVALGMVLWFINHFTPMMQDGYLYSTYQFTPGVPNASLQDVVESCRKHYLEVNGRMANNLAFLLYWMGDKSLYDILASVVILVGTLSLSFLIFRRVTVYTVSLSVGAGVLLFPCLYHTCCWSDGALNYIWAASFVLLAAVLVSESGKVGKRVQPVLFWTGLGLFALAGSMHEMLSATLLGASVLWLLLKWIRHESISGKVYCVVAAILLGALLPMTSPGIHNRAGNLDYTSMRFVLMTTANLVRMVPAVSFVFLCLMIYYIRRRKLDFLFIYACVSFVLAWVMGLHSATGCSYFYFSFAVVMCLLHVLAPFLLRVGKWVKVCVVLGVVAFFAFSLGVTSKIHHHVQQAFTLAETDSVVVLDADVRTDTEALAYICGLPINTSYIYPYLGKYHGVRDFVVIQRSVTGVQSEYAAMLDAPAEDVVFRRTNDGWLYLRLPRGKTCCIFAGPELMGSSRKCRVSICPYMERLHDGLLVSLYDRYVAHQDFVDGGLDYYHGYVFVLLPPVESRYTACKLVLQSLRSAEEEEIIVPLE